MYEKDVILCVTLYTILNTINSVVCFEVLKFPELFMRYFVHTDLQKSDPLYDIPLSVEDYIMLFLKFGILHDINSAVLKNT